MWKKYKGDRAIPFLPLAARAKMQLSAERDAVLTCIQEGTICSTGELLHPLAWTASYTPPSAHQLLARKCSGFLSGRDTFPAQFHQMLSRRRLSLLSKSGKAVGGGTYI